MWSDRTLLVMGFMTQHPLKAPVSSDQFCVDIRMCFSSDLRTFAGQKQSAYLFTHASQLFSEWNTGHQLCMGSNAHFVYTVGYY